MSTVTIYGASDDLVEVEGEVPGCDEYNPASDTEAVTLRLVGDGERAVSLVIVKYEATGTWSISVCQEEEGVPLLPAALDTAEAMSGEVGYSVRLMVPDVERVQRLDP